jgi:uncharacterized protein YjbI with pentapeptide repeats
MANANNELGEQHWCERPACAQADCTTPALSFARHCWKHLPDEGAYLEELRGRAASLHGFAGLNLECAKLKDVAGPRTNFAGANLKGADFAGADLAGADFTDAELVEGSFRGAHLAHARFTNADLSFANLRGADLTHAEFHYATFTHGDLSGAALARARFDEADLTGTTLSNADLQGASFRRVTFVRTDFTGATFAGTRIEDCDVAAANLRRADLYGALFPDTDLGRAILPDGLKSEYDRPGRYREAAEVYAELKLNFRHFGRFGPAERALYREMVAARRARLENHKIWRPLALLRNALEYVFLDLYAGYGTNPWRVVSALVLSWLGFSVYYYLLPYFGGLGFGLTSYIDAGGGVGPLVDLGWHSFQRCLYFSFVTLTKLGFTAYEPYGWAKVAAGLESSLAIVSYPVLLVTIARKIWR